MSILALQTAAPTGLASVNPEVIYVLTSDTYATVTATGYLTAQKQQGFTFNNQQMALVYTTDDGPVWLKVVITYSGATVLNTVVSLVEPTSPGSVTLPTITNHLIVSTNTVGTLANLSGIAINNGILQSGLAAGGFVGGFIAYPTTTASGFLELLPVVNASGNFNTVISNSAAVAQSQVITIPDAGNALGRFLVGAGATPFVSGNFPVASGTLGLMVDSGVAATNLVSKIAANTFTGSGQIILAKVNGTEASNAVTASGNAGLITTSALTTAAGSTYSITWTNTKITATSVIGLTIQGGTNTVQSIQFTCAPGTGTATLVINNIGPTNALNGTIFIGYSVL